MQAGLPKRSARAQHLQNPTGKESQTEWLLDFPVSNWRVSAIEWLGRPLVVTTCHDIGTSAGRITFNSSIRACGTAQPLGLLTKG